MPKSNLPATDEFDPEFQEWKRNFETKRKRVLRKAPGVSHGVAALAQKGADKDKLLDLLVFSCPNVGKAEVKGIREMLRQRIKNLRALAKTLENAADELDSTFAPDWGFAEMWKVLMFPVVFPSPIQMPYLTKTRTALKQQSDSIRRLARLLKEEAANFVRLAKHYPALNEKLLLSEVLRYVQESTGQYRERILAPLLTAAHNELGVNVDYSDAKLRKFRQRALALKGLIRRRHPQSLGAKLLAGLYGT